MKTYALNFFTAARGLVKLVMLRNRFISPTLLVVLSALALTLSSCNCKPEVQILPVRNTSEGSVKTLVARIKPGYCGYNSVKVDYREQGISTWTSLGTPLKIPGTYDYQIDIPGSNAFRANQIFEQCWTVHQPAGRGAWYGYFCGDAADISNCATFLVTQAFNIIPSPDPLVVPAGQSRTLNLNVQRYGDFSDAVTIIAGLLPTGIAVTPPSITVSGTSGTMSITTALNMSPGELAVPLTATSTTATGGSNTARIQVTSPFSLKASPDPLEVQRGGSSVLMVTVNRVSGFSGHVMLSLGGFPPYVTAPSPLIVPGSSTSISIAATTSATPGQFLLLITGTASTVPQASITTTVNVGRPMLSSVSPGSQEKGMAITVNGQGFNPTCALNTVSIGTVGAIPTSCTSATLLVSLPDIVSFGNTTISVTSVGLTSNSLSFRVRRKSGTFIDVTSNIVGNRTSGRLCPTGLVRLDISGSDISGSYVATYKNASTGAVIRSIPFERDCIPYEWPPDAGYTTAVNYIGGAGFATCNTGVVLNASLITAGVSRVCFRLLDLTRAAFYNSEPYYFNMYTGIIIRNDVRYYSSTVFPKVYHSPDGSIIAIATASPDGPWRRIAFFDQAKSGILFKTVETNTIGGNLIFTLNSNDQITFTEDGTPHGPFDIP